MTSIEIPNSVTSIKSGVFVECLSLKSITIKDPDCEIYDSSNTISNVTIYGYENSTAQAYAEKYGYEFESLGERPVVTTAVTTTTTTQATTTTSKATTTTTKATTVTTSITTIQTTTTTKNEIPGDVNGDGETTISDIVEMQKYLTNLKSITNEIFKQLDLNNDGKFNVFDLIILKRKIINAYK